MKLNKELKQQNLDISTNSNDVTDDKTNESANVRMTKKAGYRRTSPQSESSPAKSVNKEKQYNCKECFFQGKKKD